MPRGRLFPYRRVREFPVADLPVERGRLHVAQCCREVYGPHVPTPAMSFSFCHQPGANGLTSPFAIHEDGVHLQGIADRLGREQAEPHKPLLGEGAPELASLAAIIAPKPKAGCGLIRFPGTASLDTETSRLAKLPSSSNLISRIKISMRLLHAAMPAPRQRTLVINRPLRPHQRCIV